MTAGRSFDIRNGNSEGRRHHNGTEIAFSVSSLTSGGHTTRVQVARAIFSRENWDHTSKDRLRHEASCDGLF